MISLVRVPFYFTVVCLSGSFAMALGSCSGPNGEGGPAVVNQQALASPKFPQCPAVGADTGCAILLDIESDGSLRVKTDPTQGPFDGIEDTLIGVQNKSSHAVLSIPLRGQTDIFGFDRDGLCEPFYSPRPAGCPFGPTGYEGPGVSFSSINADFTSGTVSFAGGIPPGGSAYFSLEEAIQTQCPGVSGVPLLHQFDSSWSCDTYGSHTSGGVTAKPWCAGGTRNLQSCTTDANCPGMGAFCCTKTDTMRHWGCHVTADAMLVNYYAAAQHRAFTTTPGLLNGWLAQHGGFDAMGGPIPTAVAQYARDHGVIMLYQGRVDGRDDFVLDQYLCNKDPVILQVAGPHFVVATAQTLVGNEETYSINDPGYSGRTTLEPYGFDYDGLRLFTSFLIPPSALYVRGHSPIELIITDQSGRSTGKRPGADKVLEIPASAYSRQALGDDIDGISGGTTPEVEDLELIRPDAGHYVLEVLGIGAGPYTIELIGYNDAGEQTRAEFSGLASVGSTATFDVDFAPTQAGSGAMVVTPRNRPPVCTAALASTSTVWPPNRGMVPISILGLTDPDGDPLSVTITTVTQDEPLDKGTDACPDAAGIGTSTALIRASRDGQGDGRVYHIAFSVDDGHGGQCAGSVPVCVPHDQGQGSACHDGGSTQPSTATCPGQ